jgi:hypothetical protein
MGRRWQPPSVSFFAFQDIITSIVGIFVLIVLCMVLELIDTVDGSGSPTTTTVSSESLQQVRHELSELQAEYDRLNDVVLENAGRNSLNREELAKQARDATQSVAQQANRVEQLVEAVKQSLAKAKEVESGIAKKFDAAGAKFEELKELGDEADKIDVRIATIVSDDALVYRNTTREGRFLVIVDVRSNSIEVADSEEKNRFQWTGTDKLDQFESWMASKSKGSFQVLIFLRPGGQQLFEKIISLLEAKGIAHGFDLVGGSKNIRMEFEAP